MKVNPFNLKKAELQIYLSKYCKHRMPYQQHPNCFVDEILHGGKQKKTGILDIEFLSIGRVAGDNGLMLSYYIKCYHKDKYYSGKIALKDLRSNEQDKNLTIKLIKDLNRFDELITFYGSKCDIPYIRTRAIKHKLEFIPYGFVKHKDVYYLVKFRLKLSRNSLANVCKLMGIKGKTPLSLEHWIKAVTGNRKSLDYIFEHNKGDVDILEKVYDKIINYSRKSNRSI